jgi:hypothetical protein
VATEGRRGGAEKKRVTGALQDGRVRRGRCTPRHARARACARARVRAPRRIAAAEGGGRRLTLARAARCFVQRTFNQEEVQLVVKEVRRSAARRAARGRVTRAVRGAHRLRAIASGQTACSCLPRVSCECRLRSPPPDCVALAPCPLQSVETVLQQTTAFTHAKVALWQATIVENALKRLAAQNKPFKYVGEFAVTVGR